MLVFVGARCSMAAEQVKFILKSGNADFIFYFLNFLPVSLTAGKGVKSV